jgi:hypothetical protein
MWWGMTGCVTDRSLAAELLWLSLDPVWEGIKWITSQCWSRYCSVHKRSSLGPTLNQLNLGSHTSFRSITTSYENPPMDLGFPLSLQANTGIVPKLGNDSFLPHPFQFTIHLSHLRSTLYSLSYWKASLTKLNTCKNSPIETNLFTPYFLRIHINPVWIRSSAK